jgi:hypothetical protein
MGKMMMPVCGEGETDDNEGKLASLLTAGKVHHDWY